MGSYSTRLAWETLRVLDSATLTGVYALIGGPLLHPSFICKLVNNSNVLVTISIDGVTDIDVAPSNSFWLYDENSGQEGYQTSLPQGTQIFVKGSVGVGNIYLVTQYIVTI